MINSTILLLGRICISSLYLWAAFGKLMDLDGTMQYMASKNMPFIPFFLLCALFLQIVGGTMLLLGYRTRLAAWMLIIFTIPACIMFHDFWNLQGNERLTEQIIFMKDIAVIGGLLAFAVHEPGKDDRLTKAHSNANSI